MTQEQQEIKEIREDLNLIYAHLYRIKIALTIGAISILLGLTIGLLL